jgi:hypothetical protein
MHRRVNTYGCYIRRAVSLEFTKFWKEQTTDRGQSTPEGDKEKELHKSESRSMESSASEPWMQKIG